ncbi:hypothetical protein FALCPG4_015439 [Fusarium falciforme]
MSATHEGSLHSPSRHHPWLLIHPLFWTARHLGLFNCCFHQIDHDDGNTTSPHGTAQDAHLGERWSRVFAHTFSLAYKYITLANILVYEGSPLREGRKPTFFFASRLVERLDWCSVFHTHLDHIAREQLVVGYFHYDTLAAKRRERLSPCPHPRGDRNEPVIRLYRRRLSRITPIIWSQDPYLVCVLLSMAQSLRRESRSPKSFIFTARLLVTTKSDFEHIHLFEADITSELLQLFDHPTLSMAGVPWPIIKHKKISFMPYSSFQQRIMTHLLGGSTCPLGLIDGENTGVVAPQASSSKRKFEEEKQISRRVKLKGLGK